MAPVRGLLALCLLLGLSVVASGCGSEAKKDETHVTHTRVTNDEFQVALPQRHRSCVDNSNNGQNGDPFAPHLKALRKKVHGHAQTAVGTELHYNTGEQH